MTRITIVLICFFVQFGSNAIGQDYAEIKTLFDNSIPDIYTGSLGISVSVDGDIAIVGASSGGIKGSDESGMAVIYEWQNDNWVEVKRLVQFDDQAYSGFGGEVSISGDIAIVGASRNNTGGENAGCVFVYYKNAGGSNSWGQVKKILSDDIAEGDRFGISVSLNGDMAAIGSYWSDPLGDRSGSAYIFSKNQGGSNNWGQVKKLAPDDGAASDFFGVNLFLHEDLVIVGSSGDDDHGNNSGSSYIFSKDQGGQNNWGQLKKLNAEDAAENDDFGVSISALEDLIMVGARGDNDDQGAVYIFSKDAGGLNKWGQMKKLIASDGVARDRFGSNLSSDGDLIAVGAFWNNDQAGASYLFSKDHGGLDNWGQMRKITAADPAERDYFGISVSLKSDQLLVGSVWDDDEGINTGSVYSFSKNSGGSNMWGQTNKLTAGALAAKDKLGSSVSIDGDIAVVGAPGDIFDGESRGLAIIYSKNYDGSGNWIQIKKLTASDAVPGDNFGISVSVEGDIVIVGAYHKEESAPLSGAAYIFSKDAGGMDNWGEVKKLNGDNLAFGGLFGSSVSVSDNIAVVGAPEESGDGAVYVFSKNMDGIDNWGQLTKITNSDEDEFGYSVSVSGDLIAVGSSPTAYLFAKDEGGIDNWGELRKFDFSGEFSFIDFGKSVSIFEDHLIVGAPNDSDQGFGAGAAFVFSKNEGGMDNWGQVKKLVASDGSEGDVFGHSVCITDSVALVGVPFQENVAISSGSAYLFEQNEGGANNWGQTQKLTHRKAAIYDSFGTGVSISQGIALVGASYEDIAGFNSGAAFLFQSDGCPEDYAFFKNGGLTGSESGTMKYVSDGVIESTQHLLSSSATKYNSRSSISFLPNFCVSSGALFKANLKGCD